MIIFSDVKSAEAIGMSLPPQQMVVSLMPDRDASRLIQPSKVRIHSDIEPKIVMPNLSKNLVKYDLRNSQWIKEFVSRLRGGDDEKLMKSIISEADWDIASINKILKKLAEGTLVRKISI